MANNKTQWCSSLSYSRIKKNRKGFTTRHKMVMQILYCKKVKTTKQQIIEVVYTFHKILTYRNYRFSLFNISLLCLPEESELVS